MRRIELDDIPIIAATDDDGYCNPFLSRDKAMDWIVTQFKIRISELWCDAMNL